MSKTVERPAKRIFSERLKELGQQLLSAKTLTEWYELKRQYDAELRRISFNFDEE